MNIIHIIAIVIIILCIVGVNEYCKIKNKTLPIYITIICLCFTIGFLSMGIYKQFNNGFVCEICFFEVEK